jgi:uncharacterized membrane protein
MAEMRYIFLVGAGSGVLLIVLAVPMILQRVRPNPWYGFRTSKTLSDAKVWYPANRYAGKALLLAGALITVASLVLYWLADGLAFGEEALLTLWLIVVFVPLGACVTASLVYANRL